MIACMSYTLARKMCIGLHFYCIFYLRKSYYFHEIVQTVMMTKLEFTELQGNEHNCSPLWLTIKVTLGKVQRGLNFFLFVFSDSSTVILESPEGFNVLYLLCCCTYFGKCSEVALLNKHLFCCSLHSKVVRLPFHRAWLRWGFKVGYAVWFLFIKSSVLKG